jgi:signal transduction histidine kinase
LNGLRPGNSGQSFEAGLAPEAERELRRKTLWLIAVFLVVHFLMLSARAAVVELGHQAEIARARAILVPLSGILFYATYLLMRRWRGRPFLWQALAGAFLSTLAALLHAAVWAQFLKELDADQYPSPSSYVLYQSFYWYLFYFAWTTAYLALCYSITVRERERESSALLAEAQEAKIRALRYQINPHFLFNTLNSIASLMAEDCGQAEAMLLNLSEFFRAGLAVDPLEEVRLADEIAHQQLYLAIELVRFPNRLSVSVELPEELAGALVPSLILQPLVENAVRHGVARSEAPTRIAIRASGADGRLIVSVSDDASKPADPPPSANGTGVGLENVRNRLRALHGEDHSLEAVPLETGGFRVTLSLPLRFAPRPSSSPG